MSIAFFIIYGTKKTRQTLGYAADFCRICRKVQPFLVSKISKVNHLYYIPIGKKELVGYLRQCQQCQVEIPVNLSVYQTLKPNGSDSIKLLIRDTFPNCESYYKTRLKLEDSIKWNPQLLPATTRMELLIESFVILLAAMEAKFSEGTPLDQPVYLSWLFTIVAPIFLFWLGSRFEDQPWELWINLMGVAALLGGAIFSTVQMQGVPRRYAMKWVMPLLVLALKPLRPSLQEIQTCLEQLQPQKIKLGKLLKASQIMEAIEQSTIRGYSSSEQKRQ